MNLNLESVFGNDLIFYNNIINQYYDELNSVTTNSNINCYIEFGDIVTSKNFNCIINLKNQCVSNQDLAFSILYDVINKNYNFLPDEMKSKLSTNMGVDFSKTFKENINYGYINRCNSFASVTSNLNVESLTVTNCYSNIPLVFNFINTGSVLSNCGLYEFTNAISEKTNYQNILIHKKILKSVLGINYHNLFLIITTLIFVFFLFLILFNKKKFKHKIETFFKINRRKLNKYYK